MAVTPVIRQFIQFFIWVALVCVGGLVIHGELSHRVIWRVAGKSGVDDAHQVRTCRGP